MGCIKSKSASTENRKSEKKEITQGISDNSGNGKSLHESSAGNAAARKEKITNVYEIGKELGRGNYSTVRYGTDKQTKKPVAIKMIKDSDLTAEDRKALKFETSILEKLDHPNIIKFYGFYVEKPLYYIVTEFVGGGELFDRIVEKEFYSEIDAAKVIKTVAEALKYCHDRGIVHRDLKPENLLLDTDEAGLVDDSKLKLADFGFAKSVPQHMSDENGLMTSCGTPGYVAPEILKAKEYGKKVDVWSLGVILYILLCGYPPFIEDDSTGQKGLFEKIKRGDFSFTPSEYWKDVSDGAKQLISRMLVVSPQDRYSIEDVLKDPWLQNAEKQDITKALAKLKQFQAKKKWRKGINAITAANRISSLIQAPKRDSENSMETAHDETLDSPKQDLDLEEARKKSEPLPQGEPKVTTATQ